MPGLGRNKNVNKVYRFERENKVVLKPWRSVHVSTVSSRYTKISREKKFETENIWLAVVKSYQYTQYMYMYMYMHVVVPSRQFSIVI